jgi:hypothetical protein
MNCPLCNKTTKFETLKNTAGLYIRYGARGMFTCNCSPENHINFRYVINENDNPIIINMGFSLKGEAWMEYAWLKGSGWHLHLYEDGDNTSGRILAEGLEDQSIEDAFKSVKRVKKLLVFS